MTTAAPSPLPTATRAEIQRSRRSRARRPVGTRSRGNQVLAALTVLFVLAAAGIGVVAYLTWDDARSTRDATRPLDARVAALDVDLRAADAAIAQLTGFFAAVRAQADATSSAVGVANQAAQRYNNAQAGIVDALGPDVAATSTALTQTTAALGTAVDEVAAVLSRLVGSAGGGHAGG